MVDFKISNLHQYLYLSEPYLYWNNLLIMIMLLVFIFINFILLVIKAYLIIF